MSSMDISGLDAELADQVGLFSVLDVRFSWEEQADVNGDPVVSERADMSCEAIKDDMPAPATPPLPPFTSSASAPIPGISDAGLSKYLEPPLPVMDVDPAAASAAHAPHTSTQDVHNVVDQMSSQHSILKVTGLGQLARLIELGCTVGLERPGTAISRHCAHARSSSSGLTGDAVDDQPLGKGPAIGTMVEHSTSHIAATGSGTFKPAGRLKLAVRKDTPMIKSARRASIKRALAAGAPDRRAATLAKLEADDVAVSGRGPRESRWKTWVRLHRNWLPDEPVLPLTTHSIAAVTAQLKEGDYTATPDLYVDG